MTERALITVTVIDETEQLADLELGRWATLVADSLADEGIDWPSEVNVTFVDRPTMAELNLEHMEVPGPTDVLSFPIDGAERVASEDVAFIGDIVVCPDVAADNSDSHTGDFVDEVALLLVHGALHLLGHDHAETEERAHMWRAERRLMEKRWTPMSRDPWEAVAS